MKEGTSLVPAIVLVDDEPEILFGSSVVLRKAGFTAVKTVQDSRELLPCLALEEVGVVVLDLQMPHRSGKDLLTEITSGHPHIPVIIMTAADELETAVECMRAGAFDYMVKPISPERFVSGIRKALEMNSLRREITALRDCISPGERRAQGTFAGFNTRSPRMQTVFAYLEGVAPSDQPVLIQGETGAGKELVARSLHRLSRRAGEFVALNSAGLDDQVFADTLFGHRKGAYTGAEAARGGLIAKAAGGTIFLDEIGDLSHGSQVKLLRLLQEGEFYQIGSDQPSYSTARVVAATNCDLVARMAAGTFRKDLYYRICSHQVCLPPLRERREDIPLLLEVFLEAAAQALEKKKPNYPPELLGYLAGYGFPGNVRELRAMVYDAVARHKGGVLSLVAFREAMEKAVFPPLPPAGSGAGHQPGEHFETLKEIEDRQVHEALELTGGNQGAAAILLGISRQALNKRLQRR